MQNKAGCFQDMQKLTKNGQNPLRIKTMELLDEHIWGKDTKSDNVSIHDTKSTGSKGKNSKVVICSHCGAGRRQRLVVSLLAL